MMARVMILGASGMLGAMVEGVFREAGLESLPVRRGDQGFDAETMAGADALRDMGPIDWIINCVAITRPSGGGSAGLRSLLEVNAVFPWRLAELAGEFGCRLLHVSTDAVFRGGPEPLFEDDPCDADDPYGLSKRVGEAGGEHVLSIRCSIVGPEQQPRGYLLASFLRHPDGSAVNGYTDHVWNGVTTLQLARFLRRLVETDLFGPLRARAPVVHFSPNAPLTKYELLKQVGRVYERSIEVRPQVSGRPVTRILRSRSSDLIGVDAPMPFAEALSELRAANPLDNRREKQ